MSDEPFVPLAKEAVIPYAGFHHTHARGPRPQSTFLSALFVAFWIVAGVIALAVIAGVVWLASSNAFAAASPLPGVLLLIAVATLLRGVRRARAVAGLNYLEQAVRLNLPLPPMIEAAERGERGRLRRKLRRLRQRLEDGHLVAEALDHSMPGLPARTIGLIAAGERNGRLAATLARLVRELRKPPQHDPSRAILIRWYPVMLVLGLSAALGFFAIFVMPKYAQIFSDFHMELPVISLLTARLWLYVGAPLGVVMALAAVLLTGRMVAEMVAPSWARGNFGPVAQLLGWVAWWLPVAGGVVRSRGLADVCHVLADAAEAGRPMHAALRDASRLDVNVVLRRKIERWADGVERGQPFAEAAREARLPGLVTGMLGTTSARGAADAPGVFAFLARYYDGRFSRSAALLEGAMVPAMVLVFAFFVGSAALGLFLPMINLMNRMSDLTGFN